MSDGKKNLVEMIAKYPFMKILVGVEENISKDTFSYKEGIIDDKLLDRKLFGDASVYVDNFPSSGYYDVYAAPAYLIYQGDVRDGLNSGRAVIISLGFKEDRFLYQDTDYEVCPRWLHNSGQSIREGIANANFSVDSCSHLVCRSKENDDLKFEIYLNPVKNKNEVLKNE